MDRHPFLSEQWMEAVRRVRAEYDGRVPPPAFPVRVNQVTTATPFGAEPVRSFLDTTGGRVDVGLGALPEPDATVTLDYETARTLAVADNPNAGMLALAAGKIQIDGDVTKLLAGMQAPVDPVEVEIVDRIRALTA